MLFGILSPKGSFLEIIELPVSENVKNQLLVFFFLTPVSLKLEKYAISEL